MQDIDAAKRLAFVSLASSAVLALSACSDSSSDPKPSPTAVLLNQKEIGDALDTLSSAVSDLESAVSGFDSEDWKEVVPEVQSSVSDVSTALAAFKDLFAGQGVD